jgi:hypothetical protein
MKKPIILCFAASFLIFTNAEQWEGAAVVAPDNELPVTGYYVSTDTYPGNTVVDITNIETGKSTRVMVANRLGNPDLLAIVSRQAAELIGMRSGFVTRIRMVQVTEPFAGTNLSKRIADGMPEYDSGNVITEKLYSEDTYRPVPRAEFEIPVTRTPPSYVLEPEWRTRDVIKDLSFLWNQGAAETSEKKPEEIVETQPEEIIEPIEIVKADEVDEAEEIAEAVPEEDDELPEIVEVEETVKIEEIAEVPPEEDEEPVEVVEAEEIVKMEEVVEEIARVESPLGIAPAEYRPPESLLGINPADIIPGIKLPEPEWAHEPPVDEKKPQMAVIDQMFSVPRINELNARGYYVQIASNESPKIIEDILKQISHSYYDFYNYKPVVFKKEDDSWYRILLGALGQNERPLNQGESSAILQLFKSIGYANAFVITPEISQRLGLNTRNIR